MTITTLDQVVRAANLEAGYKTLHRYVLFLHFSFDALFKVQRDGVIRNVRFVVTNLMGNRIPMPENMLGIKKVGLTVGRRILTAIPDDTISLDPTNVGSDLDPTAPSLDALSFLQVSSIYNSGGGRMDGSISSPRYRVDELRREIVFDRGNDTEKVYMEIVESGINPGSNTLITQDSVLPIKSYIHYKHARFKFGIASREAAQALDEFEEEMAQATAAQSDLTGNGIMNALSLRFGAQPQ